MSDTFHEIAGAAATASSVGWSHSRFTYTKEQLKWIARSLIANGGSVYHVLEIMSDPTSNFPAAEVHCRTFKDAAMWACMAEKVQRCLSGLAQFGEWDSEIRGHAAESLSTPEIRA